MTKRTKHEGRGWFRRPSGGGQSEGLCREAPWAELQSSWAKQLSGSRWEGQGAARSVLRAAWQDSQGDSTQLGLAV